MKTFIAYICLFLLAHAANAGGVRGSLRNAKGEPLAFVTIYATNAKLGSNSNEDGSYELKLPAGQHTLVFQSIDYKSVQKEVQVGEGFTELNVVMELQNYQLKELKVNASQENPAYAIMRKAIAAAPYYRRQILMYEAKVYVKGTGKIDDAPRILNGLIKKQGLEVGRTYVTESINLLEFRQPSTYKEKVISIKSTMPFEGAPEPMRMARGSMYDTHIGEDGDVSPLSPQAFGVYDFFLEGSFFENGYEVNKIKVTPKRKNSGQSSGYLYVIEKLWCLHSCVLENKDNGMTVTVKTTFKPLPGQGFVWVPVTYDIAALGSFMGIEGSFRYLASLSDYKVKLNPNVDHNWAQKSVAAPVMAEDNSVRTEKKTISKTKNQQDIEALMAKEELSKREMLKLASKMKKESELESKGAILIDSSELMVDSSAYTKDSNFWNQNRPVPLMKEEAISFAMRDTMQKKPVDSLSKKSHSKVDFGSVFIGGAYLKNKENTHFFTFKGLLENPSYNAVEGLALKAKLQMGSVKNASWHLAFTLKAPLERLRFQPAILFTKQLNERYSWFMGIRAGSQLFDYNPNGIDVFTDAFQLLLYQRNFSKFYQQDYIGLYGSMAPAKGLNLYVNYDYVNRYGLDNLSRFQEKEGTKGYVPNQPSALNYSGTQASHQLQFRLSYKPYQQYKMVRNQKIALPNEWPELQVYNRQAWNSQLLYTCFELSLSQNAKPRHWLNVYYALKAGKFTQSKQVHFADYAHFSGNQSWLYMKDARNVFQQLPYYDYSSNQTYISGFAELSFKRLLLRQLPYVNLLDFKEQLYYHMLSVPHMPFYEEAGYRISDLPLNLSAGINFSFIAHHYQSTFLFVAFHF